MCGIAAVFDRSRRWVEQAELLSMTDAMRHRGPDDEGWYAGHGVGLGNRRLAIIDLTAGGHQPMTNEDGSVWIAYNGELYNYRELRRDLLARGHRFRSASDTEVIVHAYEEWGEDCVQRLDGMFAVAIWDAKRGRLLAARDRFGVKPLYWAQHGTRVVVGSEIKVVLAAGVPRRPNAEAVVEYFTFQNVYSERTLFDGIQLLPPGCMLIADTDRVEVKRWWDYSFDPDGSKSVQEWGGEVREALEAAVDRQLVSDVPVGSYLSGGLDSGSLVALASRRVPRLMTFTGGFDLSSVEGLELVFDERAAAESISSRFRTEHYEMVMHEGDMAYALPDLVWHLEDLRVGMSYQNYYVARLASKFVKVTLGGAGGDELFGGYPWRYDRVAGLHDADAFNQAYFDYWCRLVPPQAHGSFFTGATREAASGLDPFGVFRDVLDPVRTLDPYSKALYFERKTFLHGLLVVEDKVSMAQSLEVRVPFLDNALADLASRIPSELLCSGTEGKPVLRAAASDLLPQDVVRARKQGFSPPDQSWYRGPTMDYIKAILLDDRSLSRGWFEPAAIQRTIAEHVEGRVNHRLLLWSLLSFEWWNRLFMDGERPPQVTVGRGTRPTVADAA
jgi:asparagine synthase (glutamine-hydrolysing)